MTKIGSQGNGKPFGGGFCILWNRFAVLEGAFQKAADGVLGHGSSVLQGFAKGADFRNRRNYDVIPTLLRLKQDRVLVISHRCPFGLPDASPVHKLSDLA